MRKNPGSLTLLLACAVALLLGVGVWALMQEPFTQTARLPDGTVLRLEAVTYGKLHEFSRGAWWQMLLEPLLPPELRPYKHNSKRFDRETLAFWYSRLGGRDDAPAPFGSRSVKQLRAELWDDRGHRHGPFRIRLWPDQHELQCAGFWAFPRRGRTIALRLYEEGETAPIAEFAAPNPAPGTYPTWAPEPLPTTRRSGDLAVTLTALTAGLHPASSGAPDPPWEYPATTRAIFRLAQNGSPTDEWEAVRLRVTDATENVMLITGLFDWRRSGGDGEGSLHVGGALSVQESAWKLSAGFVRTPQASFAPDERWTVRGLVVPAPGKTRTLERAAVRRGVNMRLHGIGGAGAVWPSNRGLPYRYPIVRVAIGPLREHQQVTLRAVDDRGRKVALSDPRFGSTGAGRDHRIELKLARDAKTVDLTLAVDTIRFVEFVAKRRLVAEAAATGAAPEAAAAHRQPVPWQPGHPGILDCLERATGWAGTRCSAVGALAHSGAPRRARPPHPGALPHRLLR